MRVNEYSTYTLCELHVDSIVIISHEINAALYVASLSFAFDRQAFNSCGFFLSSRIHSPMSTAVASSSSFSGDIL